jgi:protein-histidine pros-kinase
MIRIYGEANGFGWNLNEIIGAQIVTIPMSVPLKKASTAFYAFLGFLFGVFVLIFGALHVMLSYFVLKPLERMGNAASEISTGTLTPSSMRRAQMKCQKVRCSTDDAQSGRR